MKVDFRNKLFRFRDEIQSELEQTRRESENSYPGSMSTYEKIAEVTCLEWTLAKFNQYFKEDIDPVEDSPTWGNEYWE